MSFASIAVGTPAAGTDMFSYAGGTNRLASVVNASGTRSISYDGRGNTLGETRSGGASVSTSYDGYGRLLTYNRTGDPDQTNVYNGLDDRVSVTSGGDDGVGGYAPLAMATGSGGSTALYWVHGNHLGVPIVTTDAAGAVATPTGHTLLGFPGQLRTLADLYYNRHRDYDSPTGRYIQADPIGLGGGENPYLYAEGNPLRFTDPLGLAPRKLDPNGEECLALARKIANFRRKIAQRIRALEENPQKLPEFVPGGKLRDSIDGHRILLQRARDNLARLEKLYDDKCGGGNCPPEGGSAMDTAVKVGGTAAALYVTYRIIRMIPSLAPPLWPTIPANAAIP